MQNKILSIQWLIYILCPVCASNFESWSFMWWRAAIMKQIDSTNTTQLYMRVNIHARRLPRIFLTVQTRGVHCSDTDQLGKSSICHLLPNWPQNVPPPLHKVASNFSKKVQNSPFVEMTNVTCTQQHLDIIDK